MSNDNEGGQKFAGLKNAFAPPGGPGGPGGKIKIPDVHQVMKKMLQAQGVELSDEKDEESDEDQEEGEDDEVIEASDNDEQRANKQARNNERRRRRMICCCGVDGCGIGPFTVVKEETY
jgi:hypothetical protein